MRGRWLNGTTKKALPSVAKIKGFDAGASCIVRKSEQKCISGVVMPFVEVYVHSSNTSYTFSPDEARELIKLEGLAENQEACNKLWKVGTEYFLV